MKWTVINKEKSHWPKKVTDYGHYKPFLRDEAASRCVYCAIHENPGGGYDHFHVEHFRPKSLDKFKSLEKEYRNLFYACAICNRFKSNDWPNEPDGNHSLISYPDPNTTDYNDLFEFQDNGKISGKFISSKYMVEKINLNRPQLINERKENQIRTKTNMLIDEITEINRRLVGISISQEVSQIILKILNVIGETTQLLIEEKEISKYEPEEIRRSK